MAVSPNYLVVNGVLHTTQAPPVSAFLETTTGAYTTSRTHSNAKCLLFWVRHLERLAESAALLFESKPESFGSGFMRTHPSLTDVSTLVCDSMRVGFSHALKERGDNEELAVTALVCGDADGVSGVGVCLHIGVYVPMVFGGVGARLAVVGHGRELPMAKSSEWVRCRKHLEKLRPPSVTEILLSNDGDRILEGSVTNFFVISRKAVKKFTGEFTSDDESRNSFEIQTAPLSDGILPGIIRQIVIEICARRNIPFREVAPSWSDRELWQEAFVTKTVGNQPSKYALFADSLRILQHVELIQSPTSWDDLHTKTWNEVSWVEKKLEGPGTITLEIQREIMKRASIEGYPVTNFL
ncbi:hypothetical protein QJS04_geneDACA012674 [Acorus gramineus]|uniref:D-aminoacid aminotransferase-like PLP-dependent enzyme n=1 Tax=Acorus gramineus TaxID=55184 RepID=A0AAV9B1J3_ACOGR|nr:hypothetical protein QJS04_geneDACA012674 [Acorus gramineus]